MNDLSIYSEDETEAVRDTWDAVTLGMVKICKPIDEDGGLAPEDAAAAARLQKVLSVLDDDTYPREFINRIVEEINDRDNPNLDPWNVKPPITNGWTKGNR